MPHLVLLLAASAVVVAAAAPTCDFRLAEESRYTNFNLSLLGLNTRGKSLCANGYFSGSTGKSQTLDDFLAQSEAYVRNETLKLLPVLAGGARSTDLLVLDIERPVDYNALWQYDDGLLASVVAAVRMRLRVVRSLVPRAPLALYGQQTSSNATVAAGYVRAAQLGLFDDVDYLAPVLYLGSADQNASHLAEERLGATSRFLTTSKGAHIPMAPLLSWLLFPSRRAASYTQTHDLLDAIDRLSGVLQPQPNPLPIVHFWSGRDNDTSASGVTQLEWLNGANIVPRLCLP